MVDWKRVEEFAKLVVEQGVEVRMQMYENSPHVQHWKNEAEGGMTRYWGAIEDAWDRVEPGMVRTFAKL